MLMKVFSDTGNQGERVIRGFEQALRHSDGQAGGGEEGIRRLEQKIQWEGGQSQHRSESTGAGGGGEQALAKTNRYSAETARHGHPVPTAVVYIYETVRAASVVFRMCFKCFVTLYEWM